VYWTRDDGSILRAKTGEEPEILVSGQNVVGDIVVDSGFVYWATIGDGTIKRAPLEGGDVATFATVGQQPWRLAISGSFLGFTDNATGEVWAVPLALGGEPLLCATTPGAWGLAMDESRVYWTRLGFGEVLAGPIGGGMSTTLVSDFISPSDIALAGDKVVFGTVSDAGVSAVPIAGGARIELASEGGFGVAADETHVYFGMYDGRIARVPLGGGETEVLGIGPGTPGDIALTKTSVYWTVDTQEGTILKVAK